MDTKHTDLAEKIGRIIAPEAYLEDRAGVDLMPARYDAEQKTRAILALLEPEGWRETLEAIRDKANAAVSHVGRANYRERQIEAHQWVNDAIDAAMLPALSTERDGALEEQETVQGDAPDRISILQDKLSKAVEALKELTQIVECSDWTNPDMPSWEFEAQLDEAKRRARKVYEQITKG